MISKTPSAFALIVCILYISSINAVELPGNFTLPKNSQNLCFAAQFDLAISAEYLKTDGKTNLTKIPLNNQTFQSYDGTCLLPNIHTLTLAMLDTLTTITLEFTLDEKNQTTLTRVFGAVNVYDNNDYFPNYASQVKGIHAFAANESLFTTDRSNSYRCYSKTTINNFEKIGNFSIKSIEIENLRVQPFVNNTVIFTDYGVEKVCTMDIFKSPNLIPIIVGVCLAVLVVVVLVAYLIGRRRNRNGYQSV